MEVSRIRALRGPNLWSRHTAIEAIVYCDEEERSIDQMPGFETRLRERFPELAMLRPAGHDEAPAMMRRYRWRRPWSSLRLACRHRPVVR